MLIIKEQKINTYIAKFTNFKSVNIVKYTFWFFGI